MVLQLEVSPVQFYPCGLQVRRCGPDIGGA